MIMIGRGKYCVELVRTLENTGLFDNFPINFPKNCHCCMKETADHIEVNTCGESFGNTIRYFSTKIPFCLECKKHNTWSMIIGMSLMVSIIILGCFLLWPIFEKINNPLHAIPVFMLLLFFTISSYWLFIRISDFAMKRYGHAGFYNFVWAKHKFKKKSNHDTESLILDESYAPLLKKYNIQEDPKDPDEVIIRLYFKNENYARLVADLNKI